MQSNSEPDEWREMLGRMDAARARGLPIKAQVASRLVGALMNLRSSNNPVSKTEVYKQLADKPLAEMVRTLKDPQVRAKAIEQMLALPPKATARYGTYENLYVQDEPELDYVPSPEKAVAAHARRTGKHPLEVIYDHFLTRDGTAFVLFAARNYADRTMDAIRGMISHPNTLLGLGDGGAHVGIILDASFPTFLLTYWGRDAGADKLDLGFLVKRHTLDNAQAVGFHDRGVVAAGKKADLNVIDLDRLSLGAPVLTPDLPAGGHRLLQRAKGYTATVVSGEVTYRNGEATDALPGRLVRGGAWVN
jgi:N-acyl-D-aspartate/D-glutamate deacylase